jgi:NAD(P)-dependent dehydrogenase (short-subunit alcohol dehydrogenase family)
MPKSVKPEVVVITGASAGVGRATVRAFARRGANIGLLARGHAGLAGAQQDVELAGGRALVLPTDVADPEQVEAAATAVEEELGSIDIWVNNAMTSVFAPFKDIRPEEFRRVTEVTYLGFVYGTMAALRRMLPRDSGTVVQVGSALAYRGIPLQSAYCGAKHAIQGFTESVRTELLHERKNIRLTMVQMPALNTPQFDWVKAKLPNAPQPVPPIYQPEVAADAIVWAAYHDRREMTVGAMNTVIVWGNKFFPALGDLYLAKTGYSSQQTSQPVDADRPSNLWEPVDADRDYGAHGDFTNRARNESWQLWANTHLGPLAVAGAGVATLAYAGWQWLTAADGDAT